MKAWQKAFVEEWRERLRVQSDTGAGRRSSFPLVEQNFTADEILAMAEVILSGQLTMSTLVREFERKFAAFIGAPYAVMVNSGSSANLLALAVATNPLRKKRLKAGDEVLVPAVCWSTSVWPLIQMGLKPVMVDVDSKTLNIDLASMRKKLSAKTRGMLLVHVLGNCAPMDEVMEFAAQNDLLVVEDTCEGLGVKWRNRFVGTLAPFGTYSFYFSHHMTTGEGGMVVCQTLEDYDLLKCLRAHGWTRELSDRAALEARYQNVDPRFLFVNVGYNLRPMEIQAALGLQQLDKLEIMNKNRVDNWHGLVEALRSHDKWDGQFEFPTAPAGVDPVWFGFPVLLADKVTQLSLRDYLMALSERGVENRPVVSGNFARQPALELFDHGVDWASLSGAERIHQRGFFIGSHAQALSAERLRDLADRLFGALG